MNAEQYKDIERYMLRKGGIEHKDNNPCQELVDFIKQDLRVLVIGAGGLGCEILKNLGVMGIKNIDIIDLDKIDITNLNRQFLFRKADVGKYKSEVAAAFVKKRCPNVNITHYVGKIEDFKRNFYEKYQIFIAGLDNIEARRWLNSLVYSFLEYDSKGDIVPQSVKMLIDGGTESFAGQARIIIPGQTACFECTLDTMSESKVYNFCTITHTPRIAEHCIAYAFLIEWDKHFKRNYDTDSVEDITWIYECALKRGQQFGIEGITYNKTLGVVKNIIPNIASTNSIIAAACCNEFLKVASYMAPTVDNYMMYMGKNGINVAAHKFDQKDSCIICNNKPIDMTLKKESTVEEVLEEIEKKFNIKKLTLIVAETGKYIFASNPQPLYEEYKDNLTKPLGDFIKESKKMITVFSKSINNEVTVRVNYA